jgi:hypothetical protein
VCAMYKILTVWELLWLATLLGIITTGLLTTGLNMVREKYGEIAQNPPHFPGRLFTGVQPFNFGFKNFVSDVNFLNWSKQIQKFFIAKTWETSRIINDFWN